MGNHRCHLSGVLWSTRREFQDALLCEHSLLHVALRGISCLDTCLSLALGIWTKEEKGGCCALCPAGKLFCALFALCSERRPLRLAHAHARANRACGLLWKGSGCAARMAQ